MAARFGARPDQGMVLKVLVLSDYDSRVKWGVALAKLMTDADCIEVVVDEAERSLARRYSSEVAHVYRARNAVQFAAGRDLRGYDVVLIALGGRANVKAVYAIQEKFQPGEPRPVLVGGFNGLTDRNDPDAILSRVGMDMVMVNCEADRAAFFETLNTLEADPPRLVVTGYVREYRQDNSGNGQRRVLFVQQPGIPGSAKAYEYLLRRLADCQEKDPDMHLQIVLRPEGSRSLNASRHRYSAKALTESQVQRVGRRNFTVEDRPIEQLIGECDEVWSISSTALMEGLMMDKPILCIDDFGISKANGNQYFVGSGLYSSLSAGEALRGRRPGAEWLELNVPKPMERSALQALLRQEAKSIADQGFRKRRSFYSNNPWLTPRDSAKKGIFALWQGLWGRRYMFRYK